MTERVTKDPETDVSASGGSESGAQAGQSKRGRRGRRRRPPRTSRSALARARQHRARRGALLAAIAVPWCAAIVLLVVLLVVLRNGRRDHDEAHSRLLALRSEASAAAKKVERLSGQLRQLTQKRMPFPLRPLVFDEVIQLEQGELVSILFARVGTRQASSYEYRLVLKNNSSLRVFPEPRLLLFDEVGIQVGDADVGESDAWNRPGNPGLAPQEVLAASGRIRLSFDARPAYFVLLGSPRDGSLPKLGQ